MDLWIMGLLYELIVRGSRLHGAFGEKGLVRSVYPTGGMRGRTPALSLGVWRDTMSGHGDKQEVVGVGDRKKCGGREERTVNPPTVLAAASEDHPPPPKKKKNRPEIYAEG